MASNDFAESVINGTYKKNKKEERDTIQTSSTPQASNNFAESVINGTYKKPKTIDTKTTPTISEPITTKGTATNDLKSKVGATITPGSGYKMEFDNPVANLGAHVVTGGKKAINTVADVGLDLLEGGMGYLEGAVDWGTYRLADVADLLGGNSFAEDLRKNADFDSTSTWFGHNQNVQENILGDWQSGIEENSLSPDYVDNLFKGVGQIGTAVATSALTGGNPFATAAVTYTSSYGNARSAAKRNGASDREANRVGMIHGFAETISENLFAGAAKLPVVGGWGSKLTGKITGKITSATEKYFGSKVGRFAYQALDTLAESLGEGSEEIISNILVAVGNDVMHRIDNNFTYGMEGQSGNILEDIIDQTFSKDSWDQFFSAALTSAIVGSVKGVIDTKTENKIISAYAQENKLTFEAARNQLMEMQQQQVQEQQAQAQEQPIEQQEQPTVQAETPQIQTNEVENINNQPITEQPQIEPIQGNNNGITQDSIANDSNAFNLGKNQQSEQLSLDLSEEQPTQNNNLAETRSEDVLKVSEQSLDKETDDIMNKYKNAQNGEDVFKQVEQEQGKPLRQGVKTITTATGTTNLVSDMDGSVITYEPKSNQKTLDESYRRNKNKTLEQRYKDNIDFINSNERITADKIADIETLLVDLKNNFNEQKNVDMFLDLVQQASTLGTTDAQALQFMSVIRKLSPETQLDILIKMVEKSKAKGEKTFDGVELDKNLVKQVLESKNNETEYNKAMDNLKNDIAKQMKVGFMERVNAFRYLSMLGNVKTHGRNFLGNSLMYGLQSFKDVIGSVGESVYDNTAKALGGKGLTERTKATFSSLRATKAIKNYVNNRVDNFFSMQESSNKYNDSKKGLLNDIKRRRKMFTEATPIGKALNKLNNLNSHLLDAEDKLFSKAMTKKAMKAYLVANGIKTDADIEANPELVGRALDYAFFKGQEATYHQDSTTATMISNLKEKAKTGSIWTKGVGLVAESTMPFVKTPVNIAKTSLEYTPLLGTADIVNQYKKAPVELKGAAIIDNLSKQFAGLALAGVGVYLASQGIVKGSGDGSKKDDLEKDLGFADYSIKIGNNTYDLSWLAPTAIPLFEGVEMYNAVKKDNINADTLIDTLFGALDPVTDMSVLQSVERLGKALFSNNKGNMFREAASQTLSSYLSQFIPTLLSQLAEVTDDTKRNSYTSKTVLGKTLDQIKYKIPGARQTLPEEVDIWGEPKKNADNILQRGFEAFLSPANRKEYRVDDTTKELEKLAERVGTEALPTQREKSVSVNGDTYALSGHEFAEYEKTFGKTAKKEIDSLLKSKEYRQADDETKKKILSEIYKYSNYRYKKEYSDNNEIDYNNSQENRYALVDAFDIPYYKYQNLRLSDLSKKGEKMEAIDQSDLTQEQKDVINLIQNYKYYDADVPRLMNVINNSDLSKSQKEYLITKIEKNSTKGGK